MTQQEKKKEIERNDDKMYIKDWLNEIEAILEEEKEKEGLDYIVDLKELNCRDNIEIKDFDYFISKIFTNSFESNNSNLMNFLLDNNKVKYYIVQYINLFYEESNDYNQDFYEIIEGGVKLYIGEFLFNNIENIYTYIIVKYLFDNFGNVKISKNFIEKVSCNDETVFSTIREMLKYFCRVLKKELKIEEESNDKLINYDIEIINAIFEFWKKYGVPEYTGTLEELYNDIALNIKNDDIDTEIEQLKLALKTGWEEEDYEYKEINNLLQLLENFKTTKEKKKEIIIILNEDIERK